MEITGQVGKDHVGAYAAQAAYFFMLSMIPIILLLITLVQYTPVTKADVMTAVLQVFPKSVDSLITSIVNQVYNQSGGIISLTIIVALCSAGKGALALTTGLNCVYDCKETRNYIILRIRATFYTVAFIIVIIFLLVLSVFGNTLNLFVTEHYPVMERLVDQIMRIRGIITPVLLFVFTMMIYKFLPNHIVQLRIQLMGAAFSAVGWMIVSWIFAVYLDIFKGVSLMYGSLTTIVLIMLWLYLYISVCFLVLKKPRPKRDETYNPWYHPDSRKKIGHSLNAGNGALLRRRLLHLFSTGAHRGTSRHTSINGLQPWDRSL